MSYVLEDFCLSNCPAFTFLVGGEKPASRTLFILVGHANKSLTMTNFIQTSGNTCSKWFKLLVMSPLNTTETVNIKRSDQKPNSECRIEYRVRRERPSGPACAGVAAGCGTRAAVDSLKIADLHDWSGSFRCTGDTRKCFVCFIFVPTRQEKSCRL
ncbi:hypothetical protein EVAR_93363_1 [Eumeta japonica]|uniref:Uncharacterized protein n=1 Tax=Eumeta variegata TaxID=151549 RepID=A0A4C1UUA6_EUMVA|nr:hypothetical protein EVAR_93363_1 [Eumeta japonica]